MLISSIDRRSKLPYYQQLYQILRAKIDSQEWKPGDRIPGEAELIDQYRVSRSTVRQVLDMLVQDGLINRHRGRGSFISQRTLEESMSRIVSFTEDMRQRGFEPGTQVLSASLEPASQESAEKLQVEESEELARLERLRLANGEPMSLEESFLVHRFCPDVLQHDYASQPLREILEREYGIRLVSAKQVIRAIPAPTRLANLLSVAVRSPLLFIERVSYSQGGLPVEFLRIYYRADRYSLYNELHD